MCEHDKMRLDEYLCAISDCETIEDLTACLLAAFEALGASAVSGQAFGFEPGQAEREWTPILSTYPNYISRMYRRDMNLNDSFKDAVLALGAPVRFGEVISRLTLSETDSVLFDEMNAAGYHDAVATPVFASPGIFGYFSCAFPIVRDDLTRPDLRRIQIMFTEFYVRYRQLTQASRVSLSRREHEVLSAIVHNKSSTEIGVALGVSEHTVNTYIRRCFDKLNATSRIEAALKYVSLGLELQQAR